jgi:hypothetical protein
MKRHHSSTSSPHRHMLRMKQILPLRKLSPWFSIPPPLHIFHVSISPSSGVSVFHDLCRFTSPSQDRFTTKPSLSFHSMHAFIHSLIPSFIHVLPASTIHYQCINLPHHGLTFRFSFPCVSYPYCRYIYKAFLSYTVSPPYPTP